MTGIDLTPPQEVRKQKTQYVVGISTKLSLLLFLVLSCVSLFFFIKSLNIKGKISVADGKIKELTDQRNSMSEVENYAKKLSGKYFLLQKFLESRCRYSSVMQELLARVPEGVSFDSLGVEGVGKVNSLSGSADSVVQVSAFVNSLSKEGGMSAEALSELEGKKVFQDISLDSLRVSESDKVKFTVSFKIDETVFIK